VAAIEDTFHGDIAVAGIVEIGSFAKGEAIPISDTDTRIYIRESDILYANFAKDGDHPAGFQEFLAEDRGMEQRFLSYPNFNTEIRQRLIGKVDNKISCGFIDVAHAEFLFDNLNLYPTQDHSMLFQSTIVHDPDNKRGPHQWLLKAVRCVREVIALQSYWKTGQFIFLKDDALQAAKEFDHALFKLIEQLYNWKCDFEIRQEIVSSFEVGDMRWQSRFKELTPTVQELVDRVVGQVPESN